MTLTWNGKRFDWVNVGWFAALHAGALLATWTFTWTGLGLALFLWWLSASIGHLPHLPPAPDPPRLPHPQAITIDTSMMP